MKLTHSKQLNIPESRQLPNDEEGEVAAFILLETGIHFLINLL
jgi:hypothetical protein